MQRSVIYTLTLGATLAVSLLPAYANPVAPSSRGARDPRAMCNDVQVGYDVQKNIHEQKNIHAYNQNDVTSTSNSYGWMNSDYNASNSSASGGGGFSIFGVGASGHGSSSSSTVSSHTNSGQGTNSYYHDGSFQTFSDTSSFSDTSTVKTVVGQDCSAVVQSQTSIVHHLLSW
jgi:hypothetical protein